MEQLVRRLAGRVRVAVQEGSFPMVLAGNCNSCLGTVAGVGAEHLGVFWFDAHADFDDPDENTSGFFDVMGLAMLTGRGWPALRGTIPGHIPISESNVVLAGVRDLEPYQRQRLDASEVCVVPGAIQQSPLPRKRFLGCPAACRGSTCTWILTRSTAQRSERTSMRRPGDRALSASPNA